MTSVTLNNHSYTFNHSGYLVNLADWNPDVAALIAHREDVEMTEAHWEVIEILRSYYEEYKIVPMIRTLLKAVGKRMGQEKANIRYLYELYPCGPVMQALKIAGLPMPCSCD
ncbi:MAG: TusE/DsrC/DsvC family sulfur relay protein [Magnetococcales bacterium]|nr:TusE/DsrC/DsvC family sulfur relay protein [Magnetococcales bacterium]